MTLDQAKAKFGLTEEEFRVYVADGIIQREIDFEMYESADRNIAHAKRYVVFHPCGIAKLEYLKRKSPLNGNSKDFNQNTKTSTLKFTTEDN